MERGGATLPLWNGPSLDYVGLPVTEMNSAPVGLWFSTVGLFLGIKSKILQEQNVKKFQFYIRLPNFRLLGSIIKEHLKVVNTLKLGRKVWMFPQNNLGLAVTIKSIL